MLNTKTNFIRPPEFEPTAAPQSAGVAPPISSDNTAPQSLSPNERVAGGFNEMGQAAKAGPVLANGSTGSPLDNAQWPFGPVGAPAGAAPASPAPMPQPRPQMAQAPTAEPMGFFARNTAMMRDPGTGDFLDPMAAQAANVSGPDLIQKMMNYFNQKGTA